MNNHENFDVAIIGYGPVGVTAANFLGMYGIKTAVFERETGVYHLPRAIGINHEIMRIYEQIDLHKQVESVVTEVKGVQFLNQAHKVLWEIKLSKTSLTQGFSPNYVFYQPDLENTLREGVKRFDSVKVNFGHALKSITQNQDDVTLVVDDLTNNQSLQVRAKYVLGCDGARSTTRQIAGIQLHDYCFDKRQLVVDTFLKEELTLPPVVQQLCDIRRSGVFVHSTNKHRRWEFVLKEGEKKEDMERPEKVRELLAKYWLDPNKVEVIRAIVYNFHSLLAKEWRKGRIFLVGDAAHQMPPILGQGMCSGIRDAQNISWKLNLVLNGITSEEILDTYQTERSPHVQEIIELATRAFKIFKTHNPVIAFVRNLVLRFIHNFSGKTFQNIGSDMPPLKQGILDNSPMAGQMFIQPEVRIHTGEMVLLDQVFGFNFAILALDTNWYQTLNPDTVSFLKNFPISLVKVVPPGESPGNSQGFAEIEDVSGQITDWFTQNQADVVIIRPDRYLFGVYKQSDLDLALKQLQSLLKVKPSQKVVSAISAS